MRLFHKKARFRSFTITKNKIFIVILAAVAVSFLAVNANRLPSFGSDAIEVGTIINSQFPSESDGPIARLFSQANDFNPLSPYYLIAGKNYTPPSKNNSAQSAPVQPASVSEPSSPIVETFQVTGANKNAYTDNSRIYLSNDTSHIINVDEMMNTKPNIKTDASGPSVLIVHTHTTESYTEPGKDSYTSSDSTRTQDKEKNVIAVGNKFEEVFKNNNIGVIHDTTINDYPSYSGSYTRMLNIIEGYKEKYPSIQIVLDIHRDAMIKEDGTKYKLCADIDGQKVAQVMLVVGTDEGGLYHPNWQSNLSFALRIQKKLTDKYDGFARPLNLRCERFNQHATPGSLIIEVGTDGNTLDEAVLAASYTAQAISEVIEELK